MSEEEAAPPSYYYSDATRGALGPCLLSQLRVLWVSGHISRDTSVWREGLGSWLPIHALPEVSTALLPLAHPSSHQVSGAHGPADWYFLDAEGQRSGAAHTVEQMGRLLASGELDGMSLVWREGMAEWLELGQVAELRAAGQAATEPEDEPPQEQQVFDPYDDLDLAQQARAVRVRSRSSDPNPNPNPDPNANPNQGEGRQQLQPAEEGRRDGGGGGGGRRAVGGGRVRLGGGGCGGGWRAWGGWRGQAEARA